MKDYFFISDNHFGHSNIITFKGAEGELIRPGFDSVEQMNEYMVEKWNSVVSKSDFVIHCGDVAFGSKNLHKYMPRLNGIKYLIMGNHDNLKISDYCLYFNKIFGCKYMGGDTAICTHIPIQEGSLRKFKLNIHGHMHEKNLDDKRYVNVSCEKLNYTPIAFEEILKNFVSGE